MDYIANYLAQNGYQKNLLFILSTHESIDSCIYAVKSSNFKKAYILFSNNVDSNFFAERTKEKLKESDLSRVTIINLNDLTTLPLNSDSFITVISNVSLFLNRNLFNQLLNLKPYHLFCVYQYRTQECILLWEDFKNVSEYIYIAQRKSFNDSLYDVLDWRRTQNNVELSIVFPVYKVEQYIRECVESVISWKAPYVEYIFVNDGSTDKSIDIVKEYAKFDSRIKIINKENGGCASARQVGLNHASGKYVAFVDPDDFINTTMFYKLFSKAFFGNYDIAWCGYCEYDNNTKKSKNVNDLIGWPYDYGTSNQTYINRLICYRRIAIWRAVYKKEFLNKNNIHFYTDIKRYDDLPFKIETMALAKSVISIPEFLYFYRLDREGQDVSCTDKKLFVHFEIFNKLDKFFELNKEKINDQQRSFYRKAKKDTHQWALSKLESKYKKEYKRLMKEQG